MASFGLSDMPSTTEKPAQETAIRPFTVAFPEADLRELRVRIAPTRWPEKEGVEDASQGVQLATRDSPRWSSWRRC